MKLKRYFILFFLLSSMNTFAQNETNYDMPRTSATKTLIGVWFKCKQVSDTVYFERDSCLAYSNGIHSYFTTWNIFETGSFIESSWSSVVSDASYQKWQLKDERIFIVVYSDSSDDYHIIKLDSKELVLKKIE